MLSLRLFYRDLNHYKGTFQKLHTSIVSLTTQDSSSSSSSSDSSSDTDNEKTNNKIKKTKVREFKKPSDEEIQARNTRLNTLLEKISSNSKTLNKSETAVNNTFNIAIKPKKIRFKDAKLKTSEKEIPYAKQLEGAAKDVAEALGGNTKETEIELLSKVLNIEKINPEELKNQDESSKNLNELLTEMKFDKTSPVNYDEKRLEQARKVRQFKNYARQTKEIVETSQLKSEVQKLGIFESLSTDIAESKTPRLSMWEAMEERELKLAVLRPPENIFQELILWTEQGKIWHFPIDNEQGLTEEQNVHFTEHVFLEKYLKDWCPKRGPIKHFMELVCVGLSKSPYITVAEKQAHIEWYREYFEEKKNLLIELGALETKDKKVIADKEQKLNKKEQITA